LNFRPVLRFIAAAAGAVSLSFIFPIVWSAAVRDSGLLPLAASMASGAALGAAMYYAGRGARCSEMDAREAVLSAAGAWAAVSAVAGLPYFFSGTVTSFLDALFEGTSGFTTTGATVIPNLTEVPGSILLWRSFSQWLGGVGIVVLTLAVFPMSSAGLRLFKAEVAGPAEGRFTPRIQQSAAFICKAYLSLTAAQTILLTFGGLGLFDSLTLSFSTIATGGFSPHPGNIGHFGSGYVRWVTAVFLFLAASSLTVFHGLAVTRDLSSARRDPELGFYMKVFVIFGALTSFLLWKDGGFASPLKAAATGFFHTISILSTCGFFTADPGAWPASVRLLMLMLMFCGGCAVSTAGGMTCARVLMVLRHIAAEFVKRIHPRAVVPVRLGSFTAEPEVVSGCFAFCAAYLGLYTAGFLLLTLLGQDMTSALSGAAASLGNVGPGFGMAAPSAGYHTLPDSAKCVHILLMISGRLEIFTLWVIFTPSFWRR
jgi:trk system potassium uptake protein TrkH